MGACTRAYISVCVYVCVYIYIHTHKPSQAITNILIAVVTMHERRCMITYVNDFVPEGISGHGNHP